MRTAITVAVLLALAFHSASGVVVQIDERREDLTLPIAPREIVVDRDGTGDVTSIQAGMELIAALRESVAVSNTLIVMPGYYDEEVYAAEALGFITIMCPEGPKVTRVRRVVFEEVGTYDALGSHFTFVGLGIVERVHASAYRVGMSWRHCQFEGGYTSYVCGSGPNMVACEFNANSDLVGYVNGAFDSLAVRGARLRLESDHAGQVDIRNSTFGGPSDTALVVASYGDASVFIKNCTFTGVAYGVVAEPLPYADEYIRIADCVFEVSDTGVMFEYDGPPAGPDRFRNGLGLSVERTTFKGGKTAISWDTDGARSVWLKDVNVLEPRGDGVVARLGSFRVPIENVRITDAGGRGMVLRTVDNRPLCTVTGCTVLNSGGDGIFVEDSDGELLGLTMEGNTVAGSGGAGLRFTSAIPNRSGADFTHVRLLRNTLVLNKGDGMQLETVDSLLVSPTNNLVAGNGGAGIRVKNLAAYLVHGNNAWGNAGGDYRGDPIGADNLSVDPGFCDALAGDWHVQSGSVCAPGGPFGQIGAFGVGCAASRVEAAIKGGHPINTGSNAKVPLTVFGHRLFDAGSIAPATARLAGAAAESWATEDSNGDGFRDLVLSFRARDMAIAGAGQDSLFDATLDHGSHVFARVAMRQVPGRKDMAAVDPVPERLAIESVRVSEQGGLRAAISTYSGDPATLELFDISGRRLAREVVAFAPGGANTLELAPGSRLKTGMYFVRLAQRQESMTQRVVVVR